MRAFADVGSNGSDAPIPVPVPFIRVPGLDQDQLNKLNEVLAEPTCFVDHPCFRRASTEKTLFNGASTMPSIRPWCNAAFDLEGGHRAPKAAVLSTEEEKRLFLQLNYARFRIARARQDAGRRLSRRSALEILHWAERANQSRDAIVQINMPLVLAMAKRARLNLVDFAELISEGNMALLRSVDKFDCGRGFKFSTYSCRAILKSFSRVAVRSSRYRGHFPTEFDPTLEKSDYVEHCRVAAESDCVDDLRSIMHRNLAALNDVERTVIIKRFALDEPVGGDLPPAPKTLEEVGLIIGVTKERVRQIQNRALAKLKTALEDGFLAA